MPGTITKRRFNVHEYHRMGEAGILREDDRDQLIDGEIVLMAALGSRHAGTVARLTRLFMNVCETQVVWAQNPVRIDEWSEPQPDLVILRGKEDFYVSAHPTPRDVLLLIEVSDTTLKFDREVKLPIYARAGIAEYWIVDLEGESVEVYLEPGPEGYGQPQKLSRGDSISPLLLHDLTLSVDEMLP